MRTERSFCRICTAQCGILVDMEGEEIIRVRGDKEHPLTRGYTCPKGRALGQVHHHPERIERPMMRIDGELRPVDWDTCLDDIAAKLRRAIDTDGPASVGVFYGSGVGMDPPGYRMAEALQQAIGTPARFSPLTIDGTAKTVVSSLVGGFPGFSVRPDYEAVKLVIFIGINPLISHGHTVAMPNPAPTIKAVAARGEVWVIDPRENETAHFATRHMAPRPGADYAVLAYLIRELLEHGADEATLASSTVDVEALRAAVAPYDAAHAARLAGVAEAELADLLASVRKAGRLAVETGTGVTMSEAANITQWLAWVLMIVTGSMNRPGGTWFHPGFVLRMDAQPLPIITHPFGPGPKSRPELQSFVGDWPCAAVPDEIEAGHMHAFLNLGGNLVRCFPDANALIPALAKLDLFVSIDIVRNETTALSTHVLPTRDQMERPDVTLWDFLNPDVSAQYTPAMLAPIGDRRAAWWVFAELIRRIGAEPPAGLPPDDRTQEADEQMLRRIVEHARCSFDELAEARYVATEREFPAPWVDEHVARLGGWRLAPAELVAQLQAISARQLAALDRLQPLRFTPRRQRRHVNAQLLFLGDSPEVLLHPVDADAAGLTEGDRVVVRTPRGEMTGVTRIEPKMRPGVVSVPHGHRDANVNLLTDCQEVDRLTGMVRYSGAEVTIHPVAGAAVLAAQ